MRTAEYPAPERVLLHVSDTHLRAAGSRLFDVVDARAHLSRALEAIEASGIAPDGLVFTGDLADRGEGDAYSDLRDLVEPFAARLGARVFWVMGNHDDRAQFRRRLLDESPPDDPFFDIFTHTRALGEKDLALALELADELGLDLPLARQAQQDFGPSLGLPRQE